MYRIVLWLITTMIVVPMTIKGYGALIIVAPIVAISYFIVVIINNKRKISKAVLYVFVAYIISTIVISTIPSLYGTDNYDFVIFMSYGLFVFIVSYMLSELYLCCYKVDFQQYIIRDIYFIGVLNSFITIMVLISPEFSKFIYNIIDTSAVNKHQLSLGFRSSGLFYYGGSVMSMFHCICIYAGLNYIKNRESGSSIFSLIGLMANVNAVLISGRMGMMYLMLLLIIILLLPENISRCSKKTVKSILLLNGLFMLVIVLLYYEELKMLIEWAFELFINIFERGGVTTDSTEELKSMYRFPSDIIFGDGLFSQNRLKIDSGYVLLIWFFGVVGLTIFLSLILSIFLIALSKKKNKDIFYLHVVVLSVILLGNFKDTYLFGSNGVTQLYFISLIASFRCFRHNITSI
ncbi:hypothetical protein P3532_03880 [Vibrio parahaemolyticus]|nr:hypothetical protein [Vibrio parahaemolyticus]MDF4788074.1 hypothetical protein [Vibrio parahaemolyticus]